MIESLHISNYALIDRVDIELHKGLNIITGETGAGKSIMLGALSLLLGARADSKAMRNPEQKSVVEATFTTEGMAGLLAFCENNDIDFDSQHVILRREISPGGRSRAFINDTPVNLSVLGELALELVDIHSQHQNLLLASPPYQLRVLDSLADNEERLVRFGEAYNKYRKSISDYQITRRRIEQAKREEEFLRHRFEILTEANLEPGEQEELEREREVLTNMAAIKTSLTDVLMSLSDDEECVDSLLSQAISGSSKLSGLLDDAESLTERLESVRAECRDIIRSFESYNDSLSDDPQRLDSIEQRLTQLYDLQRRFKADSVEKLIELRDTISNKLRTIELGDEALQDLQMAVRVAKKNALIIAKELSQVRHAEAVRFAELLRERAIPLGMKNLQVEISVTDCELTATGTDKVEFLFAFNKNQQLLPVGNTASGGEISRLMLCIKSIVADKMELPSLIFDEVDTGVSGDVANRMGDLMATIAKNIQVIAITHLPQVAAKGTSHFKVYKEDTEETTVTRIRTLSNEERIGELALMLSGDPHNQAARQTAVSLLKN